MLSSGYIIEYLRNNPNITSDEIEEYKKLLFKVTDNGLDSTQMEK